MKSRRKGREFALQGLYAMETGGCSIQDVRLSIIRGLKPSPDAIEYGLVLIKMVSENQADIDSRISECAENWSMDRMPVLDRIVLRCGIAEILYMDDIPLEVTINEAVQIAEKYSGNESSAFVNGVLDKIGKNIPH